MSKMTVRRTLNQLATTWPGECVDDAMPKLRTIILEALDEVEEFNSSEAYVRKSAVRKKLEEVLK